MQTQEERIWFVRQFESRNRILLSPEEQVDLAKLLLKCQVIQEFRFLSFFHHFLASYMFLIWATGTNYVDLFMILKKIETLCLAIWSIDKDIFSHGLKSIWFEKDILPEKNLLSKHKVFQEEDYNTNINSTENCSEIIMKYFKITEVVLLFFSFWGGDKSS